MSEQAEEFERQTTMTNIISQELDKVAHAVIDKIRELLWQDPVYEELDQQMNERIQATVPYDQDTLETLE